ncbi:MAG: AAA family ATPase, partial [Dehalococcoidia bacterium]|nr:AAA family ATPase [Dehalococcoidia bacterium]
EELINTIRAGTASFRPDVVFLDPLINMHSLNENDAGDMHLVLDPIRKDAEAKGYGVILVHHTGVERRDDTGKPLKGRPRGSSAIEACADLTIAVKMTQSKYVRTIETDLIRSIGVTDWKYKIVYNPDTLEITPVLEGDAYDGVIADILTQAGGELGRRQMVEMIKERTGLKGSQPYKLIEKEQKADKIKLRGEGRAQVVMLPQQEDIDELPF